MFTSLIFLIFSATMKLSCGRRSVFFLVLTNILPILIESVGVTFLDGHYYIEGVVSLFSPRADGSCSDVVSAEVVQNIESVRWTLMELNKFQNNLFGKQIGKAIGKRIHVFTAALKQSVLTQEHSRHV